MLYLYYHHFISRDFILESKMLPIDVTEFPSEEKNIFNSNDAVY